MQEAQEMTVWINDKIYEGMSSVSLLEELRGSSFDPLIREMNLDMYMLWIVGMSLQHEDVLLYFEGETLEDRADSLIENMSINGLIRVERPILN